MSIHVSYAFQRYEILVKEYVGQLKNFDELIELRFYEAVAVFEKNFNI